MTWRRRVRIGALLLGLLLIASGIGVIVSGVYRQWLDQQHISARAENDSNALNAWKNGGSQALQGAPEATAMPTTTPVTVSECGGGGSASDAYALVDFSGLPQYDYAGVAVNGDWTALNDRSMVHWSGSPAPGGAGNVIIAFHREPDFEFIDQLGPGETITIQDRSCNTYVYTVTQRWELAPSDVTQLVPTSGHELTLVTCTPWWVDYDRLVWRADLTSVNGVAT
jgi:LPXTG-site transpeptidase (sortase) family protein